MQSIITGKAYVLGDNIDTDQIIPAQYLTFNPAIPEEYKQFGKYALSSVPPSQAGLPKGHVPFHQGDEFVSPYKVIIGGRNFGCGSSREHAPIALDAAGIEAVDRKSTRLNSSHTVISYAVFCLKKKKVGKALTHQSSHRFSKRSRAANDVAINRQDYCVAPDRR